MKGYWNDPEATAETIRDGWLHTGDLVHLRDDGSMKLVDRIKDVIITGGRNVYSAEVEQAISSILRLSTARSSANQTTSGARRWSPS